MSSAIQDHRARTLDLSLPGRLSNSNLFVSRPIPRRQAQAVVDTGLRKKPENQTIVNGEKEKQENLSRKQVQANDDQREQEYVLDESKSKDCSYRPRKTLAQRIGLIEMNGNVDKNLSESAWNEIKQRSNERQDSTLPCPICQEDFGLGQQVLLSCSHVFHRTCLSTFEKFVSHNGNGIDQRTCPICRRSQYEKRIIYEGAKIHRSKCAAKIQAAWRGYIVRQWYKKFRNDMSYIPNDPRLKRKFYHEKLSEITDRIVASCDFDLNELFNEVDRNVERARAIRQAFDARIRIIDENEWKQIKERAKQRNEFECSICKCFLQPVVPPVDPPKKSVKKSKFTLDKLFPVMNNVEPRSMIKQTLPTSSVHNQQTTRPLVLLSCTHVFHATCLEMFEQYSCDSTFSCPVCRTVYQKNTFTF